MKEILKMVKEKEQENLLIKMAIHMKENGKKETDMEKEF